MSAIKISAEEMCFLVAENTSPSKVLASQAGQPPSQECVLSFPKTHWRKVHHMDCNHCELKPVLIEGAWWSTFESASSQWKIFFFLYSILCFVSYKQTNRESKENNGKLTKLKQANTEGYQLIDPSSLMVRLMSVSFAMSYVLSFLSHICICVKVYSGCVFNCILIWLLIIDLYLYSMVTYHWHW